jgi:hypothetical protein
MVALSRPQARPIHRADKHRQGSGGFLSPQQPEQIPAGIMPFEIEIDQEQVRPLCGEAALGLPGRLITAGRVARAAE